MMSALLALMIAADPAEPFIGPMPEVRCEGLPSTRGPRSFKPGEQLDYELDAGAARLGKMSMRTLAADSKKIAVEVRGQTNAFISTWRRLRAAEKSSRFDAK